jgi:hypothetical protein
MRLLKSTVVIAALIFLVSPVGFSYAQEPVAPATNYLLLAPLPVDNLDGAPSVQATAKTYTEGFFRLLIAVSGALAVVMIVVGGIQYMSTDSFSGKNQGRETIQNALWGFLLAIAAWLILNTVSGDLTNFNLNIDRVQIQDTAGAGGTVGGGGGVKPGYTLTQAQINEDADIRAQLSGNIYPVLVNNPPCSTGGTQGCTNVVGLPESVISGVTSLASNCGCVITITGGTEGGHATHGQNMPAIDLRPSQALNNYLAEAGSVPQAINPQNGTRVTVGGATYTYEATGAYGRSTAPHWHVTY